MHIEKSYKIKYQQRKKNMVVIFKNEIQFFFFLYSICTCSIQDLKERIVFKLVVLYYSSLKLICTYIPESLNRSNILADLAEAFADIASSRTNIASFRSATFVKPIFFLVNFPYEVLFLFTFFFFYFSLLILGFGTMDNMYIYTHV